MTDETYNGWTNRETWAVGLHINNDQGWQESVHEALRGELEFTQEMQEGKPGMIADVDKYRAGEIIRENVESALEMLWEIRSDSEPYFSSTFGGIREDIGSLWRVAWTELGASFLSDIREG
jgi:hypothetical protein